MIQLGHFDFGNLVTFADEFAHLKGCYHDDGYESSNLLTYNYVDNQTYNDYNKLS